MPVPCARSDVIDNEPAEAPGTRSSLIRLELDHGDGDGVTIVAAPGADDVAAALGSLDQRRHTELTLLDGSGAYLAVGGGAGRYHVAMGSYDHDDRIVAWDPAAGDDLVELVVDGRRGRYPAHDVVDLATATLAVEEFLRSGRPHPALTWRV
jgi:hypothetical protein